MKFFKILEDEKTMKNFVLVWFICAFEMGQGHISGIL